MTGAQALWFPGHMIEYTEAELQPPTWRKQKPYKNGVVVEPRRAR